MHPDRAGTDTATPPLTARPAPHAPNASAGSAPGGSALAGIVTSAELAPLFSATTVVPRRYT